MFNFCPFDNENDNPFKATKIIVQIYRNVVLYSPPGKAGPTPSLPICNNPWRISRNIWKKENYEKEDMNIQSPVIKMQITTDKAH
jgi:hypothetical protein